MTKVLSPNRFAQELEQVLDEAISTRRPSGNGHPLVPRSAITENDDQFSIVLELPGMSKDDIKVSVKDGKLTVYGERKFDLTDENTRLVNSEIKTGRFERSYKLPETIDTEKISADYRQGMLYIGLAKREETKPREIEVRVK
jgi:HSP20 family protein